MSAIYQKQEIFGSCGRRLGSQAREYSDPRPPCAPFWHDPAIEGLENTRRDDKVYSGDVRLHLLLPGLAQGYHDHVPRDDNELRVVDEYTHVDDNDEETNSEDYDKMNESDVVEGSDEEEGEGSEDAYSDYVDQDADFPQP
ncbi:hypothetical protein K438DRAFT_1944725 [Mycena galopus ATCC 62051]|nr:hypothetical protein K438DRAFT_1944725 [Mycena galopus ATCC 62051]